MINAGILLFYFADPAKIRTPAVCSPEDIPSAFITLIVEVATQTTFWCPPSSKLNASDGGTCIPPAPKRVTTEEFQANKEPATSSGSKDILNNVKNISDKRIIHKDQERNARTAKSDSTKLYARQSADGSLEAPAGS